MANAPGDYDGTSRNPRPAMLSAHREGVAARSPPPDLRHAIAPQWPTTASESSESGKHEHQEQPQAGRDYCSHSRRDRGGRDGRGAPTPPSQQQSRRCPTRSHPDSGPAADPQFCWYGWGWSPYIGWHLGWHWVSSRSPAGNGAGTTAGGPGLVLAGTANKRRSRSPGGPTWRRVRPPSRHGAEHAGAARPPGEGSIHRRTRGRVSPQAPGYAARSSPVPRTVPRSCPTRRADRVLLQHRGLLVEHPELSLHRGD